MPGQIMHAIIRALDRLQPKDTRSAHLRTGAAGEDAAYWHLRSLGYVMVARNWRSPRRRGELDIIGWEGDTLCFIEVKTRTARDLFPAEMAVDLEKRRDLRAIAREYRRHLKTQPECRFDVVSVYLMPGKEADITLMRDAFPMAE